jgi:hypothetical protein
MTHVTFNYLNALEKELAILHERFEAASEGRRGKFNFFDQQRATKRRVAAAEAVKYQLQYFQLMGVHQWEAA